MGGPGSRARFDRAQAKVTALAPTAVEQHYPTQKTVTFDLRRTDDFVYLPQLGALIEAARDHAESE